MISFYETIFKDTKQGDLDAIKSYLFDPNPAYAGSMDDQHCALTERIKRMWEAHKIFISARDAEHHAG